MQLEQRPRIAYRSIRASRLRHDAAATPASPDEPWVDRSILVDSRREKSAKHAKCGAGPPCTRLPGCVRNPFWRMNSHNLRGDHVGTQASGPILGRGAHDESSRVCGSMPLSTAALSARAQFVLGMRADTPTPRPFGMNTCSGEQVMYVVESRALVPRDPWTTCTRISLCLRRPASGWFRLCGGSMPVSRVGGRICRRRAGMPCDPCRYL